MKKNLLLKMVAGFGLGIVLGVVSNKIDEYTLLKIEEKKVLDKAESIIEVFKKINGHESSSLDL